MLKMGLVCGALLTALGYAQDLPPASKNKIDFARDVEPLLTRRCLICHGPQQQMSGFRLDQREAAPKGGASGIDIKPGDSANSRLIRLVAGADTGKKVMPPVGARLTSDELGLLRAWIDQGAAWGTAQATHWSFRKIQRPAAPAVKNRAWVRNPVDAFILARLEKENVSPSPEAGRLD